MCVAAVEACVLHGLKRRAAGFLRSNKIAALFTKVGKSFPPAEELCRKAQELELVFESKWEQTLWSPQYNMHLRLVQKYNKSIEQTCNVFAFCSSQIPPTYVHRQTASKSYYWKSDMLSSTTQWTNVHLNTSIYMGIDFDRLKSFCWPFVLYFRRSQSLSYSESTRKMPKVPNFSPQAARHVWIHTALIEKVLDKIVLYLVENSRWERWDRDVKRKQAWPVSFRYDQTRQLPLC